MRFGSTSMNKAIKAFLSGLCSITLVMALIPSLAYALPQDDANSDLTQQGDSLTPESHSTSPEDEQSTVPEEQQGSTPDEDVPSKPDTQAEVTPGASDEEVTTPEPGTENVTTPVKPLASEELDGEEEASIEDECWYDKADFYVDMPNTASTFSNVDKLRAPHISDEMKYFAKYESGGNYDLGFSPGDGYHAMGFYQFDNRYGLQDFIVACYDYNPTTYKMFGQFKSIKPSVFEAEDAIRKGGKFTKLGNDLNSAWHAAYRANPAEFSHLQDAWAYNTYYAPVVEPYMKSRGLDVSHRADCIKGLLWGMVNLFGSAGWHKFVGGWSPGYDFKGNWHDNYNYPGAPLTAKMSDTEFVTVLCDYIVANVAVFYKGQPEYHRGWQDRYRNEKKDCLAFLTKYGNNQFVSDGKGLRFHLSGGKFIVNDWHTDRDGNVYYFGSDGYAYKADHYIDGKYYYFNRNYHRQTGLITWQADGRKTYFDPKQNGAAVSGWKTIDGKTYYFFGGNSSVKPEDRYRSARYETIIDGKNYYFNRDCEHYTGLLTWLADGRKTYFDPKQNGAAVSGWKTINGKTYYFYGGDSSDRPEDHYRSARYETVLEGKTYYFNRNSELFTGLITWQADGRKSYFDPNTGAAVSGLKTIGGKTYYFHSGNSVVDPKDRYRSARYETVIDGRTYYFDRNSERFTGLITWQADGRKSYFDIEQGGAAVSGWNEIDGKTYYFHSGDSVVDPKDRYRSARYETVIDGSNYYFNRESQRFTGLITWQADGRKSYFDPYRNGAAVSSWHNINGKRYYFYGAGPSVKPADRYRSARNETIIGGKDFYFNGQSELFTGLLTWQADGRKSYFDPEEMGAAYSGWKEIGGKTYYFNSGDSSVKPADRYRSARYEVRIDGYDYYFNRNSEMQTGWIQWQETGRWSYFNSKGHKLYGTQTIDGVKVTFDSNGTVAQKPKSAR